MAALSRVNIPAGRKASTKVPVGPRAQATTANTATGHATNATTIPAHDSPAAGAHRAPGTPLTTPPEGLITSPALHHDPHQSMETRSDAVDCLGEGAGPMAWFPMLSESEDPNSRRDNDSDVSMANDPDQPTRRPTRAMGQPTPPLQAIPTALAASTEGQILEQADGDANPLELSDAQGVAHMLAQEGVAVEQVADASPRATGPEQVFMWVPIPPVAILLEDVPPTTKSRGEPVQPFGVRFQVRPFPPGQQDRHLLASRFLRFAHQATGIPLTAFCNYIIHSSSSSIDYIMESAGLARHLSRRIRAAEMKGSNHELHTFRWTKDGPRHGPEVYTFEFRLEVEPDTPPGLLPSDEVKTMILQYVWKAQARLLQGIWREHFRACPDVAESLQKPLNNFLVCVTMDTRGRDRLDGFVALDLAGHRYVFKVLFVDRANFCGIHKDNTKHDLGVECDLRRCYNCNEKGHASANCPLRTQAGGSRGRPYHRGGRASMSRGRRESAGRH